MGSPVSRYQWIKRKPDRGMDKLITRIRGTNARHNQVRATGLLFSMKVITTRRIKREAYSHIPCVGEWKVVTASAAIIQAAIERRMI